MIYTLEDRKVEIRGKDYYIDDNATLIGSVIIENNVTIWPGAVLRGDIGQIIIGEDSNVQDGSVLHTTLNGSVIIGKGVNIGHMVALHDAEIGDGSLIGIHSVVLNGAKVGKNCIVGANTLIPEGRVIPDNSLVLGSPGKVIREVTEDEIKHIKVITNRYINNIKRYNTSLQKVEISNTKE